MIAINAKAAFQWPRTGLEEYTYQLVTHLLARARSKGLEKRLLLYGPSWALLPKEFSGSQVKILQAPYLWTQLRLGAQLILDQPDVFFNTEQILPYGAPGRSVVTIHDIAYEIYPNHYSAWRRNYLRLVTRRVARRAKKIIVPSERTKRDISKFYGVAQRRIEVVYHGFARQSSPLPSEAIEHIAPLELATKNPYFLFIGRMERKKNVISLMEAFELFYAHSKKPYDLILAGPPGFGYEEILSYRKYSSLRSHIHILGYISNTLKDQLYTNASLFLFASLYEGFGLPVLEAQSFGLPVIASQTSCLPEVLGKGGVLVDPQSPRDICDKIIEMVKNKKLRAFLIKKGYENLERFSWQKSAEETLDILLNV